MKKSTKEKIVFSLLMSLVMVYGMEVYNASIINRGVSYSTLLIPITEILLFMVIVITLQTIIAWPLVQKILPNVVDIKTNNPLFVILVTSALTVCIMCPLMSLVATCLFKGIDINIFTKWLQTIAINFPMALLWQIFIAGPLVRGLTNKINKYL